MRMWNNSGTYQTPWFGEKYREGNDKEDKYHILGPSFTWDAFFTEMDTDGDAQFDVNEFTGAVIKVFHAYAVTEDGSPAAGEEKSGEEIEAERVQLKKEREQEYVQVQDH